MKQLMERRKVELKEEEEAAEAKQNADRKVRWRACRHRRSNTAACCLLVCYLRRDGFVQCNCCRRKKKMDAWCIVVLKEGEVVR